MKLKHLVFVLLALIGILYVLHAYQGHGGLAGVKNGLGFGGMS